LASVLLPDVTAPFVTQAIDAEPALVDGVAAARAALARGDVAGVLDALPRGDGLSVSFIRGLALLHQGSVEPAAVQFRDALRANPLFAPAAFYLGACYAASGRDQEAIDAWRTALLSAPDDRLVHATLAEAWLRVGNPDEALAVLAAALGRWPNDAGLAETQRRAREAGGRK
jgi:tetratricopeptide (TPR) repeat protein